MSQKQREVKSQMKDVQKQENHRNLRDDINDMLQNDNAAEGSSCNSLHIELKNAPKDLSSRISNVFQNHNQVKEPAMKKFQLNENNKMPEKIKNGTPSILNSFLFIENTKKIVVRDQQDKKKKEARSKLWETKLEDEAIEEKRKKRDIKASYISSISAKFNPDILGGAFLNVQNKGGAEFIRGNEYFMKKPLSTQKDDNLKDNKRDQNQTKEDGEESLVSEAEAEIKEQEDDGAFDKLNKLKSIRYWAEENPTIKCHNCQQFGHISKGCPNETKKKSCILCGKDTHESFDCTEKMCFKCNKIGHQARDCTEKNVILCTKCNQVGHDEVRCLKNWEEPNSKKMKQYKCIQCGKNGHLKCFKEKDSIKIKIDAKVMGDLNEFITQQFREAQVNDSDNEKDDVDAFDYVRGNKKQQTQQKKLSKLQKKQKAMFLKDASELIAPDDESSQDGYTSQSDYDDYGDDSEHDMSRRIFGKDSGQSKEEKEMQIYCAICAGKHPETNCPNKQYSRSQQFNNIRNNFANSASYKQNGPPSYSRYEDNQYEYGNNYRREHSYNSNHSGGHRDNNYDNQRRSNSNHRNNYNNDRNNDRNHRDKYEKSPKQYQSWGPQQRTKHGNLQPAGHHSSQNNYKQQKQDNNNQKSNGYNFRADMDMKYLQNQSFSNSQSYNSYNKRQSSNSDRYYEHRYSK